MATLTETTVEATFTVVRRPDGTTRINARARSKTDTGLVVRTMSDDITDQLSAARVQGASNLLDDIITHAKALWQIA